MGDKPDLTNFIKFDELPDKHKKVLKKRFQQHKQRLQRAMDVVNKGLRALAKKPKRKKAAKRKTARHK
jgi:hypothetical protein